MYENDKYLLWHLHVIKINGTHVVYVEVCVVAFDTVIQYGNNNTLSRVTFLPGWYYIHVKFSHSTTMLKNKY